MMRGFKSQKHTFKATIINAGGGGAFVEVPFDVEAAFGSKRPKVKALIEGEYHAGETAVIIDDLATTGGSKFEAIEKLTGAGLVVKDVVVLVDRQSGAKESLELAGYSMHAVLTITQMLDHWEETGKVEKDKIEDTRKFLAESR